MARSYTHRTGPYKTGDVLPVVSRTVAILRARQVGATIRMVRLDADVSQRKLGECIGCTEFAISKIESGKATVTLPLLHRIAVALGTTAGTLLEESGL